MEKSRLTDSQILAILKQNEAGMPVADLCREHGMSQVSFINGDQTMTAWTRH